jgi:hypothetical protein
MGNATVGVTEKGSLLDTKRQQWRTEEFAEVYFLSRESAIDVNEITAPTSSDALVGCSPAKGFFLYRAVGDVRAAWQSQRHAGSVCAPAGVAPDHALVRDGLLAIETRTRWT